MSRRGQAKAGSRRAPARSAGRPVMWFVAGALAGSLLTWFGTSLNPTAESVREQVTVAVGGTPAPRSPAPPKPTFEFYTMLPEMEVAVPERDLETRPAEDKAPAEPAALVTPSPSASGHYIVQVGSFRRRGDAEGLKAKLAFLGLQAGIQSVSIDGEEQWHRVRLGPFPDLESLGSARAQLRAEGFDSMVLRVKGG